MLSINEYKKLKYMWVQKWKLRQVFLQERIELGISIQKKNTLVLQYIGIEFVLSRNIVKGVLDEYGEK